MSTEFLHKKSFVVITGASRGLGRALALEFSKNIAPGSTILILARTAAGLTETKNLVEKEVGPKVRVVIGVVDLAHPSKDIFLNFLKSAVEEKSESYQHAILVHNAASIGNSSVPTTQLENMEEMEDYYNFNVSSMILLTSQFLRLFPSSTFSEKSRTVIQVTSGAAVHHFKNMGFYCSSKAARDVLIKVMSLEEPTVSFLNYNPGMFHSTMQEEARTTVGDPEVREYFIEALKSGKIGSAERSAGKLLKVLGEKKFFTGEIVHINEISD